MKAVAVQNHYHLHYVDHMAPLSIRHRFPFLFADEREFLEAKKYYPEIDARFVEAEEFHPLHLPEHYDTVYSSVSMPKTHFEDLYGENLHFVFASHGNSDKGHDTDTLECFTLPDHVLVYGQRMIDFLKERNVFERVKSYSVIGNIRFNYYLEHKAFYDALVESEVFAYFGKRKKRILYAPTWDDEGTFFEVHEELLRELPQEYQIIVKLHPYFVRRNLGLVEKISWQYEGHPDILFLKHYPLIYPLLAGIDVYLGDASSIGYDFLAFDRPLFFFNKKEATTFLQQAGTILPLSGFYPKLQEGMQTESLLSKARKKIFNYTFG